MLQRCLVFLLTLCLCWQALAHAGVGVLTAKAQRQQQHELLHFEGLAHHHDEQDGDFHQDESPASNKHSTADAGVFAPALLTEAARPSLLTCSEPPCEFRASKTPQPCLSGPERPPKTRV
ncbi:hypothetical protein HNP55_004364 [Paucibacter oligotrophus]|uniref:Uncharacterized protein n=1 Tax=Roseateles oligotrophus TaxID=1769250 RepID=A0A840LGS7_9BURK|nr:hypothetical protein [Roseateles oligotrophus]MBB4845812.1 hypothetical protein [Roseateles oligotrophus]